MPKFPRSKRLLLASDFQKVFKASNKLSSHGITVLFRLNQSECARLGLAVARRQLPLAVDRNRLKRLIRETFRLQQHLVGVDVVVIVKSIVKDTHNALLIEKLNELWTKLSAQGLSSTLPIGPKNSC